MADVRLAEYAAFLHAEVHREWAVDCPVEGLVECDSEAAARAWLAGADPHPGQVDRLLSRVVLPWREVPRG